jgi:hypothetical protein
VKEKEGEETEPCASASKPIRNGTKSGPAQAEPLSPVPAGERLTINFTNLSHHPSHTWLVMRPATCIGSPLVLRARNGSSRIGQDAEPREVRTILLHLHGRRVRGFPLLLLLYFFLPTSQLFVRLAVQQFLSF